MVRSYRVQGTKRKRKVEKYDTEEAGAGVAELESPDKRAALVGNGSEDEHIEEKPEDSTVSDELSGIPLAPVEPSSKPGAIFVLEKASLEVGKVGKGYQILNSEDHANFLRRNNKNPADYRPDIVHQALLSILDSPLNKAGRVRAVYVRTEKGVLFEVKPHVRIPRTYKRFAGIMLQLLQKLSITAAGKREKLLRTIKNPVTQYFPANARKIGFSYSSEKSVEMRDYLGAVNNDENLVFVVGAMSHGKIDKDYTDDYIAVSGYPLSAAWCISTVCVALQQKWKIF